MRATYPRAEMCIYCGSRQDLSKEHILAYSLGGTIVLGKASCKKHRDMTSVFELNVARTMYGKYRDIKQVQSRHPENERSGRLFQPYKLIGENYDGTIVEFDAPLKDIPLPNIWMIFTQPPTIISTEGLKSPLGIKFEADSDESKYQPLFDATGFKKITVESSAVKVMSPEYFQMLAKTAHAFLWAEKGGKGFSPLLLGIIEGEDTNFTRLIGCDASLPRAGRQLSLEEVRFEGQLYYVVHITINAFPATPRYLVVAGFQY